MTGFAENIINENNGCAEDRETILEMIGISKAFPGVQALDGVDLKVRKGTVHVLVGENGAGKSTLMKVLSGVHPVDSGEIYFKGQKLGQHDIKATLNLGISMIHQELSPVLDMTVGENIFLGREPEKKLKSFVDYRQMYSQTKRILDDLGLAYDPKMKMRQLSVAGMQLIEIAKALSRGASLIIMDEPTSAITDSEVDMLFEHIENMKKKGVAVIYITHKLDEVFRIADDITVIRDGRLIETGPAGNYDHDRLVTLMVGRTISNIFPKQIVDIGEVIFEVKNLTSEGVFKNINFSLRKGEILGLAGLVGAGRTEVSRAIFGLDPLDSGEIFLEGKQMCFRSPDEAVKNGVIMLSEDRKLEGLVLCRSIRENVSLANLQKFAPKLLINMKREEQEVLRMVDLLSVKLASIKMRADSLSGGNQQKLVIAKWLLGDIKVLILDEPTRGIDVGAKAEIHKIMCDLAKKGLGIIMISSELPEILGMSDRIIVMHEGVLRGEIDRKEADQESIMKLAVGGNERNEE